MTTGLESHEGSSGVPKMRRDCNQIRDMMHQLRLSSYSVKIPQHMLWTGRLNKRGSNATHSPLQANMPATATFFFVSMFFIFNTIGISKPTITNPCVIPALLFAYASALRSKELHL